MGITDGLLLVQIVFVTRPYPSRKFCSCSNIVHFDRILVPLRRHCVYVGWVHYSVYYT